MKDGVLQFAQIGCGAFAEGQDLPNFRDHAKINCKWCCDISPERAQALANKFDVQHVTADFHEVMADPEVDAVKLATTHEIHLPIIEAAARAGKHVFCEKPMALEEKEALQIIRAVRRGGIKLCVDLNRRMAPSMHALKRRWQEQRSNPQHHAWRYSESERAPFPEEAWGQFLIRVQDDSASYRVAHLDPLLGGGEILGESVHWLDLACWFYAPQVPVEIQAWGSQRFSHGIHLKFSGGDTATIIFDCGGTFDFPKERYEVASDGALLQSNHFVENRYYGIPGLDHEIFPLQRDSMPEIGTEGGWSGYNKKYDARVRGVANSKEGYNELFVDKGHSAMLNAFVEAVINDTPSPCDEMAGYLSTYLAKLAIKSIENRQILPVPVDKVVFNVR